MREASKSRPILVKRYARSRFYDTTNRRYVSVEQLRGWAAEGVPFRIIDVEDGKDIRSDGPLARPRSCVAKPIRSEMPNRTLGCERRRTIGHCGGEPGEGWRHANLPAPASAVSITFKKENGVGAGAA